jgi:hypothetical protein
MTTHPDMTTQPKAMMNLDAAIATYSDDATSLYDSAHKVALGTLPPDPATVKDAQNQLAGAFSQLGTAAKMEADQIDRAGLAAVVQLMQTTADNAEKISNTLVTVLQSHQPGTAPPTDFYPVVNALTSALGVLAQLSPSAVWTTR